MKNRFLPFGYMIINGVTQIHPQEAPTVMQIFRKYLEGQSFKRIAEIMCESHIEFLPGRCDWNKNRISRIICDSRYCGENGFPAIILPSDFAAAKEKVKAKNTQQKNVRKETVSPATAKMICGICGAPVSRRTDHRTAYKQKFCCSSCGAEFHMTSEILNKLIIALLKTASLKPTVTSEKPLAVIRLETEIERLLESGTADPEVVRQLVFDLAAEKYRHLSAGLETMDKLRADLAPAKLASFNIRKTVMETVKEIRLIDDKSIAITLINDQMLQEAHDHGTGTETEIGTDDSPDNTSGTGERKS